MITNNENKIYTGSLLGVDVQLVSIESSIMPGRSGFHIVGMATTSIQESRKRILTVLQNLGLDFESQKIIVSLSPGDIRKEGSSFDLPILLSILLQSSLIVGPKEYFEETLFCGEISFEGYLRPVRGILSVALAAKSLNKNRIVVSSENAKEAALVRDLEVISLSHISQLIPHVSSYKNIETVDIIKEKRDALYNYSDIKGQQQAKRLMQICAAGWHNSIIVGPPGAGKSMLAQRLSSIMPEMTDEEIIDTTKIYSLSGNLINNKLITERPFRSPHHSISTSGLIGGGGRATAGEISLAHNGVLFLDELTEFKRDSIESLRQPIESKNIIITRQQQTITLPASFLLITALNPCPCGFLGDNLNKCRCSNAIIQTYLKKLSGPLLDRIDLQLFVPALTIDQIQSTNKLEISSQDLKKKIDIARRRQDLRLGKGRYNGIMEIREIDRYCILSDEIRDFFQKIYDRFNLSMRGYHKLLKICRTIADLEDKDNIEISHLKEALLYRSLDQQLNKFK